MEIPAWAYLSIWAIIDFTFLHLGFNALDRTGLSSSVPPLAMSIFKHSLAISACHSSSNALIFRQRVKLYIHDRYLWVPLGTVSCLCLHFRTILNFTFYWAGGVFTIICYLTTLQRSLPWLTIFFRKYYSFAYVLVSTDGYAWFFPISTLINFALIYGKFDQNPEQRICAGIHMALETSLFLVSGEITKFFPIVVIFVSFITSSYWAELSGLEPYTRVSGNVLLTNKTFWELFGNEDYWENRALLGDIQRMLAEERYQELLADEEVLADERIRRMAGDERFQHLIPAAARQDEDYQELLRVATKMKENFTALKGRMTGKWIEFAIGMAGTVLFQSFFKLTSFDHVVAYLYVVIAWLATIALVGGGGSGDLGIFNFLLGNVIVGCTVSQFGLRGTTWIAYGISVLLFGLRLKLQSLRFVNREGEQSKVVLW